jgi:hypothetical protein
MTYLLRYWKPVAALLLCALCFGWGYKTAALAGKYAMASHLAQDAKQQAKDVQDLLRIAEKVRAQEQALAAANAAAGEQYEKGKRDAEAAGKRVADDLRAGNLKLRKRWQGCVVPGASHGSGEPDAEAADRAESAGRIIRTAHEADEQIKGLQDILRAERK